MSTINTSVSRAVTGRSRRNVSRPATGRSQVERRRAPGTLTTLADADQRDQGVLGFPLPQGQPGGFLGRLFPNRFGGQGEPSPAKVAPTAPLTDIPAAGREGADALDAAFPGLTPEQLDVIANSFTPADVARDLETSRVAGEANLVVDRQLAPLEMFEPGGGEFAGEIEAAVRNIIANPEAISDKAAQAAISAGTETILGRERASAQQLQENLAARGISDSGLSFALAQAGGESSARGIAGVRRDVLLQQELARSAREDATLRLASSIVGDREQLGLLRAQGISQVTGLTEVPTIGFGNVADDEKLDAAFEATSDDDAERQFGDLLSTGIGGITSFLSGQLLRMGNPILAAAVAALGLGGLGRIQGRGA